MLAGGRGSRLGGIVKPAVEVAGRSLLSRVLDARGLARRVVVVGPESARQAADDPAHAGTGATAGPAVVWALEDPPFGGPVAGIVAGLAALDATTADRQSDDSPGTSGTRDTPAEWLILLACDLPWAADAALLLVSAAADPALPATVDGLHLSDDTGRAQWLAGIYRTAALRAAAARLGTAAHGASMRALLADLSLRGIRDETGAGRDVDTWQDVERSTTLLTEQSRTPPRSETE